MRSILSPIDHLRDSFLMCHGYLGRLILLLIFISTQTTALAKELSEKAIQSQQSEQHSCVDQKLPECIKKCKLDSNVDIDCGDLCTLNITNECRYAGE